MMPAYSSLELFLVSNDTPLHYTELPTIFGKSENTFQVNKILVRQDFKRSKYPLIKASNGEKMNKYLAHPVMGIFSPSCYIITAAPA